MKTPDLPDSVKPQAGRRSKLAWVIGALVFLIAIRIATTGLFWSTNFHPDEAHIARWIDDVRYFRYVRERAYPGGWFEMYRVRFWLEDRAKRICTAWERHSSQDGAVDSLNDTTYLPSHDFEVQPQNCQDGRDFNACLYVIAALLVFATCLEIGMHPLTAGVSAAFFLASAGPIEFLHYCETDEGLVVSLAAFAWLAARSIRLNSPWLAAAGCFAAGFAVSCKPTLMPTLLWCVTAPFVILRRRGLPMRRLLIWIPVMLACGCAAACLGYLYGTPAMRLDPDWYFASLRRLKRLTYAEIYRNLGGSRSKWAADVVRLAHLHKEMAAIGWLPLSWGIFSWTFWFRRDFRAQLAGAPFLLPLFFPFLVFLCPFVRSQETLPIAVIFALGAALPLEWWRRQSACAGRARVAVRLSRAAVAAWGIAAFVSCALDAAAMSSCFQYRDSRVEAQNWLFRSLPAGAPVGLDSYVGQTVRGVDCDAISLGGLPYIWDGDQTPTNGPRYYVENVGFLGRLPVRDLRTGRIRQEVSQRHDAYMASTFPLKTWSVPESPRRPTFGQPVVRLVGFEKPDDHTIDVPIGYLRPIVLLPDGQTLYDSFEANGLGANCALHTVGKRYTACVSFDHGPRWLVTRMLHGNQAVRIRREGLASRDEDELRPGGAVVTPLRPAFAARLFPKAWYFNRMRCRMRGDDQAIVCASFLARSMADAARELRTGGDPIGALELLKGNGTMDGPAKVEAFLAACAAGVVPDDDWRETATKAWRACDDMVNGDDRPTNGKVSLCGTPLCYAKDFARVRVKDFKMAPGQRLPLFLPAGNYDVTISIMDWQTALDIPPRLLPGQVADMEVDSSEGGATLLRTRLELASGTLLSLPGEIDDKSFTTFRADIEVAWDPIQRTMDVASEIGRALGH